MKTDVMGCSTCKIGDERYEVFQTGGRRRKKYVQYDYRHVNGKLFSCVGVSVEACRKKRDNWIDEMNHGASGMLSEIFNDFGNSIKEFSK